MFKILLTFALFFSFQALKSQNGVIYNIAFKFIPAQIYGGSGLILYSV
jgi:hypothetical protein